MEREKEVRCLAYTIWQEEGCPDGRHVEHWLKAEAIVQGQNDEQPSKPKVRPPQRKRVRRARVAEAATQ